jgi:hypothetical protein
MRADLDTRQMITVSAADHPDLGGPRASGPMTGK